MAGGHSPLMPSRCMAAQKGRKQQRVPGPHKALPPEEEDPRLKCKDCGAFGHKASSLRCPMKRWGGALAPQSLGSKKMKENRIPRAPKDLPNPGAVSIAAREREQRARHKEQIQALLQRFPRRPSGRKPPTWKGQMVSGDYGRHPTRPMPVHTTQKYYVTRSSPIRKPGVTSSASLIKGAQWKACSPGLNGGQGVRFTCTPHAARTCLVPDPNHTVQQGDISAHSVSPGDPQASIKTSGLGQPFLLQPLPRYPHVDSHSLRRAAAQSWGQDSKLSLQVPGKRAALTSTQTCQNAQKKPKLSLCVPPRKGTQRPEQGFLQTHPPPASPSALRPAVEMQAPTMTTAQGQSIDPQPPHAAVPGFAHQPLRMAFTRLGSGQWSSRFISPPWLPPAEKPSPAGPSPFASQKSEGLCAPVLVSVLHEDLQLSSSSEESGCE